jgi:hypothetical protein
MSDFLTVTADTAASEPETTGGQKFQKTPPDPRFWKPTLKNEAKEYPAMIRMLPRGLNGLKNKLNPSVKILTHRLKSEQAKVLKYAQDNGITNPQDLVSHFQNKFANGGMMNSMLPKFVEGGPFKKEEILKFINDYNSDPNYNYKDIINSRW